MRSHNPEFDLFTNILLSSSAGRNDFTFLVAGGHDGVTFDSTRNFARKFNWKGVVLEPQPKIFLRLQNNYAECSRVVCLNAALSAEDGEATLYKFAEVENMPYHASMLASFNKDALEFNGHDYKFPIEEISVRTVSLNTILCEYLGNALDYLQTDTEGHDYFIIKQAMELEEGMLPNLIKFEGPFMTDEQRSDIQERLRSRGYKYSLISNDWVATRRDLSDLAYDVVAFEPVSGEQRKSSVVNASAGFNLLQDPDFSGGFDHWSFFSSDGEESRALWSIKSDPQERIAVISTTIKGTEEIFTGWMSQPFEVLPQAQYSLSADMHAVGLVDGVIRCDIQWIDYGGNEIGLSEYVEPDRGSWYRVSTTSSAPPAARYARLRFYAVWVKFGDLGGRVGVCRPKVEMRISPTPFN